MLGQQWVMNYRVCRLLHPHHIDMLSLLNYSGCLGPHGCQYHHTSLNTSRNAPWTGRNAWDGCFDPHLIPSKKHQKWKSGMASKVNKRIEFGRPHCQNYVTYLITH